MFGRLGSSTRSGRFCLRFRVATCCIPITFALALPVWGAKGGGAKKPTSGSGSCSASHQHGSAVAAARTDRSTQPLVRPRHATLTEEAARQIAKRICPCHTGGSPSSLSDSSGPEAEVSKNFADDERTGQAGSGLMVPTTVPQFRVQPELNERSVAARYTAPHAGSPLQKQGSQEGERTLRPLSKESDRRSLRPGEYVVQESADIMDSLVRLSSAALRELDLDKGDNLLLQGARKRQTVARVAVDDTLPKAVVQVGRQILRNIKVKDGGTVTLLPQRDGLAAIRVLHILPVRDTAAGLPADPFTAFLKPYFQKEDRPVHHNDIFTASDGIRSADFKVVRIAFNHPYIDVPFGVVDENTAIYTSGDPVEREDEAGLDSVLYEDLPGMETAIGEVRTTANAVLKNSDLYRRVGMSATRGILISGPPGCGKTQMVHAMANDTGVHMIKIKGSEFVSHQHGESENNLRKLFKEAKRRAPEPVIIFLDDLDVIAPRKQQFRSELERKVIGQLNASIEELNQSSQPVLLIATTNKPGDIDTDLRRSGRFEKEISLSAPDQRSRRAILDMYTAKMPLGPDVDLDRIAMASRNCVGADIKSVCAEALRSCIDETRTALVSIDNRAEVNAETLNVRQRHFDHALSRWKPAALREISVEIPQTGWADIGGLEEVKEQLRQMVSWPLEHPELYDWMNQKSSGGLLLYGPPGVGKTLIAKAIAHESQANFISVKGPELLNMWLGGSEANVRDIFEKARASTPCVIFFDEIDSLAVQREFANMPGSGGAKVVNQLLTEMDGVGTRKGVYVIGATNKPTSLDKAMLRPGRLDQLVYIPMPDERGRRSVLASVLRGTPQDDSLDLDDLARRTDKYTGADLANLVRLAKNEAIEEALTLGTKDYTKVLLTNAHLQSALGKSRRSVSDHEIREYEKINRDMSEGREQSAS